MKRSVVRCILAIGMTAATVQAQSAVATTRSTAEARSAAALLARSVTVQLERVSLKRAVNAIAQAAGVHAQYRSRVLDAVETRVSLRAVQLPLGVALERVLAGTGLRVIPVAEDIFDIEVGGEVGRTAQTTGVVTGVVMDAQTKRPLRGAAIILDDAARGVMTDGDGTFRIAGVSTGEHSVSVRLLGYLRQMHTVHVEEGQSVALTVLLQAGVNTLDQVVVTGTVVQTELKAVPNAITIITAKQIEERGITHIDQLFRGDVPGVFALNVGSSALLDEVTMYSRGATALTFRSAGTTNNTNPIKTYIDGVEMADSKYLSQIDPKSIERIEILTGPQASTLYGSNAINGVMQIFTKRGSSTMPQGNINLTSGVTQNNLSSALAPSHTADANVSGMQGRVSYNVGGSWNYIGAWTPAKQTQRVSANSGGRLDLGTVTADVSGRYGVTTNRQRGDIVPGADHLNTTGVYEPRRNIGTLRSQNLSLTGSTLGVSLGYRLAPWWSHTAEVGTDASSTQIVKNTPYFLALPDTALAVSSSTTRRTSEQYNTTLNIPFGALARLNLTFGGDHWRSTSVSWNGTPQPGTGSSLASPNINRPHPSKNSGAFVQGQLALVDALFLTYGVRTDWNPNFGNKAQVKPGRYGASFAQDVGSVSVKLRGSYGQSIRPPAPGLTLGLPVTDSDVLSEFGAFDFVLANPELAPEHQSGGEGGLELYFGSRGSLIVTRYNQTVDNLISDVNPADSVRSLPNNPPMFCSSPYLDANGSCFFYQTQFLNVGSIRNQGWELQGNLNVGPFTANGTYSWIKSRVIGITPKYRALLQQADPIFEPGRPFDFAPEHVWAFGVGYTSARSSLHLSVNGTGMRYITGNAVTFRTSSVRLMPEAIRMDISGYRPLGSGYAIADLNATHRLSTHLDASLQVMNLTDYYPIDSNMSYATAGRQSRIGVRVRL